MDAFFQNLGWGLDGMLQSLLNWILGAFFNALFYGMQ